MKWTGGFVPFGRSLSVCHCRSPTDPFEMGTVTCMVCLMPWFEFISSELEAETVQLDELAVLMVVRVKGGERFYIFHLFCLLNGH